VIGALALRPDAADVSVPPKAVPQVCNLTDLLAAAMLQLALAGSPKKTLNTSELNGIAKHVPVTVTTTLAKQEVEALPTKPRDCGQLLSA
jgi:hypothetical protein